MVCFTALPEVMPHPQPMDLVEIFAVAAAILGAGISIGILLANW